MLHISHKTEKSDTCCALLALSIQLMTGEPRPPVQRAPVTWREWGLWFLFPGKVIKYVKLYLD